jgi:hypothetical protein
MSLHIAAKKVGGFLWKVAPYVLAVGGAVSTIAGYFHVTGREPEGPFHERRIELQTNLRAISKDNEKHKEMKREYDEIMARPGVREAYRDTVRKRKRTAAPFFLGGIAALAVGLWWERGARRVAQGGLMVGGAAGFLGPSIYRERVKARDPNVRAYFKLKDRTKVKHARFTHKDQKAPEGYFGAERAFRAFAAAHPEVERFDRNVGTGGAIGIVLGLSCLIGLEALSGRARREGK